MHLFGVSLLGILGTVLGIVASFDMLSHAGIDDPRAVTGGIAQALITTATGLTIAIVSVIFLNFFQSRIGRAVGEMEQNATSLEIVYEKLSPEKRIDTLLDEPTTALDPSHQVRIMDLMERLRQERKTTVIMVSHDVNLAAMYGDRLLLMKKGTIIASGRPEEVCTSELLQKGYDCPLYVDINPLTGGPLLVPVPKRLQRKS